MNETINVLRVLGQGLIRLAEEISNISDDQDRQKTEAQVAGGVLEQSMVKEEPHTNQEPETHTLEGVSQQEETKEVTNSYNQAQVSTVPEDEVTLDEIKAALKLKIDEGKRDQLTALFATFGVNYLMEVPQTQYGTLLQALKAL